MKLASLLVCRGEFKVKAFGFIFVLLIMAHTILSKTTRLSYSNRNKISCFYACLFNISTPFLIAPSAI